MTVLQRGYTCLLYTSITLAMTKKKSGFIKRFNKWAKANIAEEISMAFLVLPGTPCSFSLMEFSTNPLTKTSSKNPVARAEKSTMRTVSYTHLDVYKRQNVSSLVYCLLSDIRIPYYVHPPHVVIVETKKHHSRHFSKPLSV